MWGTAPDDGFQIFDCEAVRNPGILASSLCVRTGVPCLGNPPNARATAKDERITTLVAMREHFPCCSPGLQGVSGA